MIFLLGCVLNKNVFLMSGDFVGQSISGVTFWYSIQIDLFRLQAMLLLASFHKTGGSYMRGSGVTTIERRDCLFESKNGGPSRG